MPYINLYFFNSYVQNIYTWLLFTTFVIKLNMVSIIKYPSLSQRNTLYKVWKEKKVLKGLLVGDFWQR